MENQLDIFKLSNSFSVQFDLIYYLLDRFNFRISEILNLNINSFVAPKHIIFKLSKSKNYFVVSDKDLYSVMFRIFSDLPNHKFSVNYLSVYHWILKKHPESVICSAKKNNKVTHAFRYKNAELFSNCERSEEEIKALLKHNSVKSQKYYIKKTA